MWSRSQASFVHKHAQIKCQWLCSANKLSAQLYYFEDYFNCGEVVPTRVEALLWSMWVGDAERLDNDASDSDKTQIEFQNSLLFTMHFVNPWNALIVFHGPVKQLVFSAPNSKHSNPEAVLE